jgi:hypothetical protein
MIASDLTRGVTQRTALAVVVAAVAAGWLGGGPGVLGVVAGGALALGSFRLLTAPWSLLAGLRFAVVAGVAGLLFVQGWAHPVAWLVGYSALPLAVVLQGLRVAGEESRA